MERRPEIPVLPPPSGPPSGRCLVTSIRVDGKSQRPGNSTGDNQEETICSCWIRFDLLLVGSEKGRSGSGDHVLSRGGVEEADNRLSSILAKLDLHRETYEEIIEEALYQHPQLIGATSPESELPTSSIRSSSPISSKLSDGQRGVRDRNQNAYTIKRSCHQRHRYDRKYRYVETLRSEEENRNWGSESQFSESVFSKGFVDSIMTNHSGKGAFHSTSASSSLPQYSFGDQSAMEQ